LILPIAYFVVNMIVCNQIVISGPTGQVLLFAAGQKVNPQSDAYGKKPLR